MMEASKTNDYMEHCKVCLTQCVEHHSELAISSIEWPDINHELAFYNSYIKGRAFESRFSDTYEPINDMVKNLDKYNREDMEKLKLELMDTTLIEDNFLKFHIHWPQYIFQSYEDEPKFTLTGFFAKLGATTNLYAGITFILIFEVLELLYNIGYAMCFSRETEIADL